MLHTWNWIPHPNGVFAHENLAIPFLRTGLSVPTQEFLESEEGHMVIQALRLAHGDIHWWYWRAFSVVNATSNQRRGGWGILVEATQKGKDVLHAMRAVDEDGNRVMQLATSARERAKLL